MARAPIVTLLIQRPGIQDTFDTIAEALDVDNARGEIADEMAEVIGAFAHFERRDWLAWGAKVMPAFAERVAKEDQAAAIEKARRSKERAESALAIEKTRRLGKVADAMRKATSSAKDALLEKRIGKEEFARRMAAAQTERDQRVSAIEAGEESEVEPQPDSEVELISSSQGTDTTLRVPRAPTKRKSDDSIGGLLVVEGRVSRFDRYPPIALTVA